MGDEWVSGDANPNTEVDLLRECIAAGLAIMNGFPWRSDKFVHSAAFELAAHDEKVRAEERECVLAEVRKGIGLLLADPGIYMSAACEGAIAALAVLDRLAVPVEQKVSE